MPTFIGMAMILGIAGGITIDTIKQTIGAPIVYAREPDAPRVVLIEVIPEEKTIEEKVKAKATEYGVPFKEMWDTILCESGASTTIQSYHIRKDGTREPSYGLAQIHLEYHPTVTKEQAIDPDFAIDFMAKNWHKVRWYCRK
jgi:hypothetical protein